jgi:hypothetical protein
MLIGFLFIACKERTYKILDKGIVQAKYDSLMCEGISDIVCNEGGCMPVWTPDVYAHKIVINNNIYEYIEKERRNTIYKYIKDIKEDTIKICDEVAIIQVNNDKKVLWSYNNMKDIQKTIQYDKFRHSVQYCAIVFIWLVLVTVASGFGIFMIMAKMSEHESVLSGLLSILLFFLLGSLALCIMVVGYMYIA